MLRPVHTPVGTGDRITDLQSHLTLSLGAQLVLTTLAVRRFGQVDALVIVHTGDGCREPILAGEARQLAANLRLEWGRFDRRMVEWADSLDAAARAADRQADALVLGQGSDAGARQSRVFGGR